MRVVFLWYQKLDKDSTRKLNYKPVSLMNKSSTNSSKMNPVMCRKYTVTKWVLFQEFKADFIRLLAV